MSMNTSLSPRTFTRVITAVDDWWNVSLDNMPEEIVTALEDDFEIFCEQRTALALVKFYATVSHFSRSSDFDAQVNLEALLSDLTVAIS